MQIMFYLVTGLFVICIIATVTTFKEVPLKDSNSYKTTDIEELHSDLLVSRSKPRISMLHITSRVTVFALSQNRMDKRTKKFSKNWSTSIFYQELII